MHHRYRNYTTFTNSVRFLDHRADPRDSIHTRDNWLLMFKMELNGWKVIFLDIKLQFSILIYEIVAARNRAQMNINEPKAVASVREVTVAVHQLRIRPEAVHMAVVAEAVAIMVATVRIWVYRRRLLVYLIRRQVGALP